MQNTSKEVHSTWFCRKLSSSNHSDHHAVCRIQHITLRVFLCHTQMCASPLPAVHFTLCHPTPNTFSHCSFHVYLSVTPPLFSIYLLRPSGKFLVVYCQTICSQYSYSYPVSKATLVSSCSDMTRKVSFVIEVTNHKVVWFKKVNSRVVRQELTPLSAVTTWGHMQKLPSYFQ